MTDTIENTEEASPVYKMLMECEGDPTLIGERISGVLEFLTLRAVSDAPFMIFTDNEDALVLFAAGDVTKIIRARLNDLNIKRWEDAMDENSIDDFLTDSDPGDEQPEQLEENDEPASEQE